MEESKQAEPMVQEAVAEGGADNMTVTVAAAVASEADRGQLNRQGMLQTPRFM